MNLEFQGEYYLIKIINNIKTKKNNINYFK